jgi:hypothetical protein
MSLEDKRNQYKLRPRIKVISWGAGGLENFLNFLKKVKVSLGVFWAFVAFYHS